jgi:DNA anti-recombination protein RmuC
MSATIRDRTSNYALPSGDNGANRAQDTETTIRPENELQRQEAIYQAKHTDAKRKCATAKATFQSELAQRIASVREECKQRIDKMDQTVKTRRAELQAAMDTKMKAMPAEIEEE